jgi:3-hydroxyacyl-[acyl-carrier-protein] dehydratase
MRYLLIDRVLEFERDRRVVAIKNVTLESDVMEHHAPGFPLFPGALTLESMAQAAGYLVVRSLMEATGAPVGAALSSVDRAHFRRPVLPGDQLRLVVEWTEHLPNAARLTAHADVDGLPAAHARLLLVHRPVDAERHPEVVAFARQLFRSLERSESLL